MVHFFVVSCITLEFFDQNNWCLRMLGSWRPCSLTPTRSTPKGSADLVIASVIYYFLWYFGMPWAVICLNWLIKAWGHIRFFFLKCLELPHSWQNMGPWTPDLSQKYLKRQEATQTFSELWFYIYIYIYIYLEEGRPFGGKDSVHILVRLPPIRTQGWESVWKEGFRNLTKKY